MAYSEELANRIHEVLADVDAVTPKKMFGGIAFLVGGHMSVGILGDDLIVRVGPEGADAALSRPHTRHFDVTGRPMTGWVMVGPEGTKTRRQLAGWVDQGVAFAQSLPAKVVVRKPRRQA